MIFLCSSLGNKEVQIGLKESIKEKHNKLIEECKVLLIIHESTCGLPLECVYEYKALIESGFKAENISVLNLFNGDSNTKNNAFDCIFVPGGNTFDLMKKLRESGLDEYIKQFIEDDRIYIGESAGAIILFPSIKYVLCLEDNNAGITDYNGLNIVDGTILCHYDESRRELLNKLYADRLRGPIYVNRNDEYLIVENK